MSAERQEHRNQREERMRTKKNRFLRVLNSNGCYVEKACGAVGVTRPAVSHWRDTDEEFAAAMDAIKDRRVEIMEEELDRRAFQGVDKPIYYKGERVDTVKEYSDNLLMFRLKALKPETYRDGPKAGKGVELSDAELDAALQRMMLLRGKKVEEAGETSEAVN